MKLQQNPVVKNTRLLITNQLIIGVLTAIVFLIVGTKWQGISAIYGMMSTILISLYLMYGVLKAEKIAASDPKMSLGILYFGAAQRFVMVIGFFIIGLSILKLEPLATAVSFGLTQFAYVFNLRGQARIN